MRLRIYILTDPRTGKEEQVYEYPTCLASPILLRNDTTLVTREPLRIPIIIAPNEYLADHPNLRESSEIMYGLCDLYDYWQDQIEKGVKAEKKNNKLDQLQRMFSPPICLSYLCKTTFFTGPKAVYKQTFDDMWAYKETQVFALANRGQFRTIENLSFKGPNEIFVTGTFEVPDDSIGGFDVQENTQCKIVFIQQSGVKNDNL